MAARDIAPRAAPGADAASSRWDSAYHAPVLVDEVLTLLSGARRVLDGTLGGGGHSGALLSRGMEVVGMDRDPIALAEARARLASFEQEGRFRALEGNYADVDGIEALAGQRFDGILLDLGVSSRQLDDESRGFSFRPGAPLDMRMGTDARTGARELLASIPEAELARIFRDWADEPRANRLAREIVRRRATRALETSDDLVNAIRAVLGPRAGASDFARLFQGVRIAVNDELRDLERALPALRDRLAPEGVLVVIAYHSGEDRIVKNAFREWSTDCVCPPRQPICTCRGRALGELLTRKAVAASDAETARNARARSARLRAYRHGG